MTEDENYMGRALQLAQYGIGAVSPNPLVGCVIVHNDKIIGEGWHRKFGEAHAEVNAVASVENHDLFQEATAYVTLEPCSHFGKTPPCSDLLIDKGFKKVVVGCQDPNPKVAGKGIQKLIDAGIEVVTGVLEKECISINRRFFTSISEKRPYIILKWAQTSDGYIAREDFSSKWISNPLSRQIVHKMRAEEDAILIGKNTALYDNPKLDVRDWIGKDPLRIIVDRNLKLPRNLNVFKDGKPTIYYNTLEEKKSGETIFVKLYGYDFLKQLFEDLHQKGIQSVLVEGGATILNEVIRQGLWDEAFVFTGSQKFGQGISAPLIEGNIISSKFVGDNELKYHKNIDNQWLKT